MNWFPNRQWVYRIATVTFLCSKLLSIKAFILLRISIVKLYKLSCIVENVTGTIYEYLGTGYNLINGNPEVPQDPGLLLNKHILAVKCTIIEFLYIAKCTLLHGITYRYIWWNFVDWLWWWISCDDTSYCWTVDTKWSYVNTNLSHVNTNRSHVNTNRSHVNTNLSHVNTNLSHINTNRPHVNTNRSHVNTNRSHVKTHTRSLSLYVFWFIEFWRMVDYQCVLKWFVCVYTFVSKNHTCIYHFHWFHERILAWFT